MHYPPCTRIAGGWRRRSTAHRCFDALRIVWHLERTRRTFFRTNRFTARNGMLDQKMSGVIIFVSSGLFVYWLSRTFTLLHGSDTEIDEMLAPDLWVCS